MIDHYKWRQRFPSDNVVSKELVENLNTTYQSKAKVSVEIHRNGIESARINWFLANINGRILDIGCADGVILFEAARRGFEIVGVDIVDACLERAKEFLSKESEEVRNKISIQKAWSEELPFFDMSFNTVVLAETLEHVSDPIKTLQEAHRVLINGGKILISVPNGDSFFPSHFRHYNREEILKQVGKYFNCSVDDNVITKRWQFIKGKKESKE